MISLSDLASRLRRSFSPFAQQQAVPTIGIIGSLEHSVEFPTSVRKGLAELGYVEGRNFRLEVRETNYQVERHQTLYRELVDQNVALILAGTTTQLVNAKAMTQSIPIVFSIGADPVESGFIASRCGSRAAPFAVMHNIVCLWSSM